MFLSFTHCAASVLLFQASDSVMHDGEKKNDTLQLRPITAHDRRCRSCHTHFADLPSHLPRLPFLHNGRADRLLPFVSVFVSHTVSQGQPVPDLRDITDCCCVHRVFMTCTRTHISGTHTRARTHTLTQISRGQDLTEATQPISLQIRLITLQRGPVNNPHRGC